MANILQGIHEYLSHISCMFLICFVGGLACLITGARILLQKKVTMSAPKPSRFEWYESITIKGARSRYYGIYYLAFGSLLIFVSILMFSGN
jgi:hypothetical protein